MVAMSNLKISKIRIQEQLDYQVNSLKPIHLETNWCTRAGEQLEQIRCTRSDELHWAHQRAWSDNKLTFAWLVSIFGGFWRFQSYGSTRNGRHRHRTLKLIKFNHLKLHFPDERNEEDLQFANCGMPQGFIGEAGGRTDLSSLTNRFTNHILKSDCNRPIGQT